MTNVARVVWFGDEVVQRALQAGERLAVGG